MNEFHTHTQMCCLCKPLQWLGTALALAFVFVVGGYLGKFFYLEISSLELVGKDFWLPDAPFWIAGTLSVLAVVLVWGVLYAFCACIRSVLCCECCCSKGEKPARRPYVELEKV